MSYFNRISQVLTLSIGFLLGISSTQAQESALLYKLEKEGIQPSYLYGTIHLMPNKDFDLKEPIKKAFDASELIVLEMDMDDPGLQGKMMQMLMMGGDSTLESLFSEEDYQLLDQELQTYAGMGVGMINKMKPLMVMTLLLKKYVGDQPASYEGVFVRMAQEKQKEILGLETIEDQMAIFDAIPYEDQAEDISEMLRDEGRYTDMFAEMVELYKAEDIEGLYKMFTSFYEGEERILDLMLHDRNKRWIPKIGEMAKEQAVFFGVGAGHLGGEEGVVQLLRDEGYTLTPVH